MKPFKNIALVYPCDVLTLHRAAALSKDHRARLTIVYPVEPVPPSAERLAIAQHTVDIKKLVEQEFQARLKQAAADARSLGVRPATRLLTGNASIEIIRDVIAHGRDLVVMTAEGKGGLRQRLFGSTSAHLMRKCPVPLLIMKPGRRERFQRVLAAVDPNSGEHGRDSLNDLILQLAQALSARDDADLHVVHAWTLLGESLLRGRGGMAGADVDRVVHAEAEKRRRAVRALLDRLGVTHCQLHLPKGNAAELIPRLVARLEIDLLVMGTVCRTGIPGFIIGNTAERVLDTVDCSVLVVKPEAFVSPVTPRS